MRFRAWFVVGGALCAVAAVWHFTISPVWEERLPTGWTWQSNFIGVTTYVDAAGNYPETDESAEYSRLLRIADESGRPRSIQLEQRVTNWDIETRAVTWESSFLTLVDPRTGVYVGEDYEGHISVFPRHTEKIEYRLHIGYIKSVTMTFESEEEIAGITTYLFGYKGRGEYTEAYRGTEEYPGIPIEPGQEIKCNDEQYIINAWVEPITGELVKWEESCYAGDAVYDIASGQKVYEIDRWGGVSRGDESVSRAQALRWQRIELLAMTRYIPGLLLIIGLGAFVVGILSLQRSKAVSTTG